MRVLVVCLLVAVAILAVSAQQQQQRTPQQQQQLRQQQQQRQQQQRRRRPQAQGGQRRAGQQGQRRRPAAEQVVDDNVDVDAAERECRNLIAKGQTRNLPLHCDPNLTLSKISKKDLDAFLRSKTAVQELVNCFDDLRRCKSRAGVSLVRDVRSLGRGAECVTCDPDEQKHTKELVGNAIAGLQQHHPVEWRRLLPNIGFLF